MKTTKKGFTLIELIVVIAIIGVLAAILVPAMLGYVKKSKLSSADSAASSLAKAGSSAMLDLDNKFNANISGTYWLENGDIGVTEEDDDTTCHLSASEKTQLIAYIKDYFSDISKCEEAGIYFVDGTAVGAYASTDGVYYGTNPGGLNTANDYKIGGAKPKSAASKTKVENKVAETSSDEEED